MDFPIKTINRSFRKFNNYSQDLLNSNYSSFKYNLSKFIIYCNEDPIINHIMNPLSSGNETLEEDYNAFLNGFGKVILPFNEEKRLSVIYTLLQNMSKGKPAVEGLAISIFPTSNRSLDNYVSIFLEQIFFSFARDIQDRLDDFLEDNEKEEKISETELCIFKNCIINIDKSKHTHGDKITVNGPNNNIATNGSTIEINSNEELKNSLEKIAEELKNNNKTQEAISAVLELSKLIESDDRKKIEENISKAVKNENSLKSTLKGLLLNASSSLAGSVFFEVAKPILGIS